MNRPSQTWILFGLSLVVAVIALGRVSFAALNLEESQRRAELESQREDRIQRALGRVEGWLNLLIAREEARGSEEYEAFVNSPRAYVWADDGFVSEEVLIPSPLLGMLDTNLWLHFEFRSNGVLSSPQVPASGFRPLVESLGIEESVAAAEVRLGRLQSILDSPSQEDPPIESRSTRPDTQALAGPTNIANADRLMTAAMAGWAEMMEARQAMGEVGGGGVNRGRMMSARASTEWVMVRRVEDVRGIRVQGCWMNWPVVRRALVRAAAEVLPDADIRLATGGGVEEDERRVFRVRGVVLELVPGVVEVLGTPGWSPVRVTLGLAWVAVICAVLAVGLLLNGAVSLSERRAAFVSAVTHELRTPLTTFKMYSEMLATGMVSDEEQRKRYLETLRAEADRLGYLVENVLAYARIERGSARSRVEPIALGTLLDQILPRLQQRAEQAGTRILCSIGDGVAGMVVYVDASAAEQILFNLVDNACKYGTGARVGAAPIELEAREGGSRAVLVRLRDHGPGVSASVASKLFQPFCKSADEAARSAPGVGLGLALSRRLIRSMGGNLHWDSTVRDGACFELSLPRVRRGAEPTIA